MRRLALFLFLASIVSAKEYRLLPPHVPVPKIVEAVPPPQTHVFAALDVNNAFTGNNTHSGTETFTGSSSFQNFIQLSGGTCTVAGLQAALTAVTTVGGKVDATGCTTISTNITNATGSIIIPANVQVLLGPSTWTCSITTASTPCWWLQGSGAQLIGAGSGSANQGTDPSTSAALGITNFICSACGTTTDMVRVSVPTASRISATAAIINSNVVVGLFINMGNSGRDATYVTSGWKFDFHDLQGFNIVGNGLHIEADVSTAFGVASYNWGVSKIIMQPIAANTTGAACYLDAQNGEIAYFKMDSMRCRGNFTTGGGLAGLLMLTSGAQTQSIDSGTITNSTIGDPNPTAQGNGWGVKMKGSGAWPTSSVATINNINFSGILLEHQFGPNNGTGIGCTNGSDVASGAACGSISLSSVNAGGWTTGFDRANLGEAHGEFSSSIQDFGSPAVRVSGNDTGPNAQFLRVDGQANYAGNSQFAYGGIISPTFHDKGFNTQTAYGLEIAPTLASGAVAGNFTNWAALHLDGSGLANGTGLYVTNSLARFGTGVRFDETTSFGAGANIDVCYGDSTAHALQCSYNNGSFFKVPLVGIANTWTAAQSFGAGNLLPSAVNTTDVGSAALPFVNLWLGTAATNNFKFQPTATTGARIITIADPLSPTTVGLPLTIASGTTTLTSNAALAAVTSQAANTTAATGVLATDVITWSFATAPTAGDNLCHVLPYVTAGNVNFVRTNPTAAAQNVSALVINWKVVR